MSIHLSIPGIAGESSDANHADWIDVLDLKFGNRRRITSATSTQNDRESSNVEITDLELRKFVDSATPKLFIEACCGRGKEIIIELTKTGSGSGADTFMRYTLKNALVSSYEVDHVDFSQSQYATAIRPVETVTISFVGLEVAYTPFDQDGNPLAKIAVGFDTATNIKA